MFMQVLSQMDSNKFFNPSHHAYRLGVVIWHISPNGKMWATGYDYTSNFRDFLLAKFCSNCYTAIAQPGYIFREN